MRRKKQKILLIFSLLLLVFAGNNFINLTEARSVTTESISPPPDASPPVLLLQTPRNNTIYNVNNVTINFNVSIPQDFGINSITKVTYNTTWLDKKIYVHQRSLNQNSNLFVNCSDNYIVPDGNHAITINAFGRGVILGYFSQSIFDMLTTEVIHFIVDTAPPKVSILSLENKTLDSSDVSLNFSLSEKAGLVKYSLDGQKNSTLYGNLTLTGLLNAKHNLTIYAWDVAGNLGVSETVFFDVNKPDPFPTTLVLSSAIIVIVGLGIFAYFKKRRP